MPIARNVKGLFRYWREDLSFGGKLLSSFAVLLVAFAVPLPLSYVLVRDSADQADAARRAIQVMQQVIHVEHDLGELRSAASDYAARPTASRRELLDDARAAAVQRVRSIPASSRSQRKRVDTVVDGIDSSVAQLQADVRDSDPDTAMLDFNTAVRFDIQRDAVELADEAQSVAVGRHVLLAERTREHLMRIVALLAAALVFAVVIGLAVPRLVVARLFLLRGTTRRLTAGDLASRADIAGRDELAQLGADFDALAVSLERRESENQALLARERDRALRDSLTGLYNRGYFDEAFAGELARVGRRQGKIGRAHV